MNLRPMSRPVWYAAAVLALAAASAPAQPNPTPDHIVIVIEENRSYNAIIGSASAPYINGLVGQGALLSNMFAITHPSQPNYIALFSGSTQGVTSDATPTNVPFTTPNLGAQLIAAGRTFVGYSEDLPSVGFTGNSAGGTNGYVRRHNPWVNWQQVGSGTPPPNQLPPTTNQPYTAFPTDYSALPTLSFVIPALRNDMHAPEGTIAQGDAWLAANLDGYVQWAKTHNSLFILTWDEDDLSSSNRIPTLLIGQMVQAGVTSSQMLTHYGMLGTLEDMYGLGRIANSVGTTSLNGIWATPVPEPTALLTAGAAGGAAAWARLRRRGRGEQLP
jgi:phosphatidylinositol-3-phosphatase